MESEENKISVWVCREEKLVLGLSKRTTCADVIKVLLEDQNSQQGLCAAQSYCIVEKWRGCERILPNKTRILRLWVAWGDEQRNVKFVLVKSEVSLDTHGARSAEARVVLSKQSPCIMKGTARCTVSSISPEKQRRIVRKAFRKLEKINKKRSKAARRDASGAEKMETLVHSVVSQDHTIRQQIQRITELDAEIERCEAKVHMDRIKRHGANYVQNTYLVDVAAASSHEVEDLRSSDTLAKLEKYFRHREEMVRLQEGLWEQETLIDVITGEIQEELNHRWMQRRKEELWKLLEEERIKTQLNASLYIGLRLNADLEAIRSDLELTEQICGEREREIRDLLEKVNTLGMEEGTDTKKRYSHGADVKTGMMSTLQRKNVWVEQARGLSKTVNDDDSDTGLSSLHSQDSDSLPVWESLV
uniref:Ras association domain family member 10 n=1 Tax=Neolamprologus brichardi TaxID=32507 RepID=A0A3Q4H0G0_NEOBR